MDKHFSFFRLLYTLAIYVYGLVITLFSLFNKKAHLWKVGRRSLFLKLSEFKNQCEKPIVWVHCASLGEFEQGRPVIEQLKNSHPEWAFLVTFFSPSGYEVRKNYLGADLVCYLPLDTPANAKRFVTLIAPKFVIFVKYEYWFNYMIELYKQAIPLYVIAAIFRPNQHFFISYGYWFADQLRHVSYFFVQNQLSCDLLQSIHCANYTLSGDTRFDRVLEIQQNKKSIPIVEAFCNAHPNSSIWVVGSSWHPDELLFVSLLAKQKNVCLIIAPHEIDDVHVAQIKTLFGNYKTALFSTTSTTLVVDSDILIVNTMGMLSQIFQYANIAYIGGGFGTGIHNILEAAVYEIPVVFGPKYHKFDEAISLIEAGGAFSVHDKTEFIAIASLLMNNKVKYSEASKACKTYVEKNTGATQKICNKIVQFQM